MIYFVVLPAILAIFIYITLKAERCPEKIKSFRALNLIIGLSGALVLAISLGIGFALINLSKFDTDWIEWANNMFSIYFSISLPVFGVLIIPVSLASLISVFEKKTRRGFSSKVRLVTPIAASVLLMFISFFYSSALANENVPLDVLCVLSGIGQALAMRLPYSLEYTARIRQAK